MVYAHVLLVVYGERNNNMNRRNAIRAAIAALVGIIVPWKSADAKVLAHLDVSHIVGIEQILREGLVFTRAYDVHGGEWLIFFDGKCKVG